MASTFITDAIFANLKKQMEDAMRTLVRRIAEGEGLDASELETKYLAVASTSVAEEKKPKKPRAAKVTVTDAMPSASCCKCTTAKGKPCSLKPLPGTSMCRLHTKKAETDGSVPPTGSATGPIKEKKKKKSRAESAPMHTHDLDEQVHDDCELCQTHGNPLDTVAEEEEFETVRSPPRSLRERLSRVATAEEFLDEED
jgi:hypothetical protein